MEVVMILSEANTVFEFETKDFGTPSFKQAVFLSDLFQRLLLRDR
jgi:hypothetical protein